MLKCLVNYGFMRQCLSQIRSTTRSYMIPAIASQTMGSVELSDQEKVNHAWREWAVQQSPLFQKHLWVFDMAGTTVNENGVVYDTLRDTLKDAGLFVTDDNFNLWHGANKREVIKHFININDNTSKSEDIVDILCARFEETLLEKYFTGDQISLIHPDLPDMFEQLRQSGSKIALNTGYSKNIQNAIIYKLGLNKMVDGWISSQDVRQGRPAPYMIQELMKRLDIDNPIDVGKCGDTVNDIKEGHNAGVGVIIGVLTGADDYNTLSAHNPTLICNSVMDLITS